MSIRRDKIQLEVEINGKKAGRTYGELINDAKNLKREILKLTPGTEKFIKKSAELKKVNDRLTNIKKGTKGVADGMRNINVSGGQLPGLFKKVNGALNATGILALIAAIVKGIQLAVRFGKETLQLYDTQAKADAQLKNVIKSTNAAAGKSFEDLKRQAQELQNITLFGDEQTQGAQAILLTFTKIKGAVFDQALPAVLDMATALKVDLKAASIQVGKALNDPIKGVAALGKAGVQFSEDQKELIKSLVNTGQEAEAQKVILKELETQFKGSAQAAAEAGTGGFTQLANKFADIKEKIGFLFKNGLDRLAPLFTFALTKLEFFIDGLFKIPAVFAGVKAAVNQLAENFKISFSLIDDQARLLALRLQRTFAIRSSVKESLDGAIAELSNFIDTSKNQGQKIGEAFNEAYQTEVEKVIDFSENFTPRDEQPAPGPSSGSSAGSTAGLSAEQKAAQAKKLRDQAFKTALADIKAQNDAEALLSEQAKILDQITEAEHTAALEKITIDRYEKLLAVYSKYNQDQTAEALAIENKLLTIKNQATEPVTFLVDIQTGGSTSLEGGVTESIEQSFEAENQAAQAALNDRYRAALISEKEYQNELLALRREFLIQKLLELQSNGDTENALYKELLIEKLALDKQVNDMRLDEAQRFNEENAAYFREGAAVASGFADLLIANQARSIEGRIDLINKLKSAEDANSQESKQRILSEERELEKAQARKKIIEVAQVKINLAAEISNIFKGYSALPIAGQIIAVAQAVLAGARAAAQIKTIQSAATGGKILGRSKGEGRNFTGSSVPNVSGTRVNVPANIAALENGDNILALVKKNEVVLNDDQIGALGQLVGAAPRSIFSALKVPGFTDGGLTSANTTPPANFLKTASALPLASSLTEGNVQRFENAVERLEKLTIKAVISYDDLTDTLNEIEEIENIATVN